MGVPISNSSGLEWYDFNSIFLMYRHFVTLGTADEAYSKKEMKSENSIKYCKLYFW